MGVTQNRINVLNEIFLLCLRFHVYLPAAEFIVDLNRPAGCTHIVLNYIGPNAGIKVYFNGAEVGSETTKFAGSSNTADGRVVVGRFSTDGDYHYTSLQLDELIFFNKALSTTEITAMYNAV